MSKYSVDEIKKKLKSFSRPPKIKELARLMGVGNDDYPEFRRFLKEAISRGEIIRLRGGRLATEAKLALISGRLVMSGAGHGFVMPDNKSGEVYISPRDLGGALHGEDVRLLIKDTRSGKNREGKIIEVVNREKGLVVGHLNIGRFGMYITPNDPRFSVNIEIDNPKNLTLKDGLIVTIRLNPWEAPYLPPRGFVEEILGEAGTPGVDIESLVVSHGLPREFPAELKPELAKIRRTIPAKEGSRRKDFRDITVFTIDPPDAKDHDDAISLEALDNGNYRLGVHIADVSYYVTENSALDKEAKIRGNSVYLVDRVIPMLPEKLSSDICSLVDSEDRLTLSFVAEIDIDGKVIKWEFCESIIRSTATLSYEEVQDYFDNKGKSRITTREGKVLDRMLDLSRKVRSRRLEKGSLDFDLPEPKVLLDKDGKVIDIYIAARLPSHQIVEEFMLLANSYAATMMETLGAPILYRVHARPDKEKIENFGALLREIGYGFSFKGDITPKKIQRVMESVKGKPDEPFVQEILLRSLAKAIYQPENIGHFGLAFQRYTHFTSPIRRYPDLLVHRVMRLALNGTLNSALAASLASSLKAIGVHCTATEIAADEAERESVKIKQLEYLSERVGGIFDGVISGLVKPGFFVKLNGNMIEGFVPFSTIKNDYYILDEGKHQAHGRRNRRVIKLGDSIRVIVARIDLEKRRADFAMIETVEIQKKKAKKRK
jgi:ribonuclease R